jgi:ring-1,2-phenylacetyl-CoA epoxidase subunit PaaD
VRAATAPSAPVARPDVREIAARVTDPEIPVLTIADLGVLRDVTVDADGRVAVTITPTYSGCPAVETIKADLLTVLGEHGYHRVDVRTVLAPAWTADWMSVEGRRKLEAYGIAPPGPRAEAGGPDGSVPVYLGARPTASAVCCPRCGSSRTREVSRFGSTACKSLHACRDCLEPFEHFKAL